ncbi:dTDP-4-dehydrorhamnose reductase [Ferviditalea candida]|uniref:dTDP-4-dehydrorhamnose reductase n=1 Tax=Ferviditalea candida TaxID=3108399 RepID=A0ABU5ZD45_9BACL|nr:dTDP-4-dehydrorhamnose reductase [Paenibacillaceae bacterium T2]
MNDSSQKLLKDELQSMRVMITGASGQLGYDLIRTLNSRHRLNALSRRQLDVTDEEAVQSAVQKFRPDVIIHTAAYTDVDGAESAREQAFAVNGAGTRNVAVAAEQAGTRMVYISTDYVFDGKGKSPYTEFETPSPINVYGKSKLAGEHYVQMFCSRYYIVRTAWLYGIAGQNFVTRIISLASDKGKISAVVDQIGSPTYTLDLAEWIGFLILTRKYGIYHAVNQGFCSRYEWVRAVLEDIRADGVKLLPARADEFKMPAARPAYAPLDGLAARVSGLPAIRNWRSALRAFINEDLHWNSSNRRGDQKR